MNHNEDKNRRIYLYSHSPEAEKAIESGEVAISTGGARRPDGTMMDMAKPCLLYTALVASDVASEGLNLHYLSHRMIHFDIPWSLMVFQQRNVRIDRYGQQKRPDSRYMMIESNNPRIKGDMRIIEILITK